jgi:hypothetical protein
MVQSTLNPATLPNNSQILPASPYVNIPASDGRLSTNNLNAHWRAGCGGLQNYQSVPSSSVNNLTPLDAAINIPFSDNNQFQTGGYRYRSLKKYKRHSKKGGKSKKLKKHFLRKNKKSKNYRKSRKSRKHKKSRKFKLSQRGGSSLGFAPIGHESNIQTSRILNNRPYSQGFSFDGKSSTDFGALAQPIPINTFAKCPPKINFN